MDLEDAFGEKAACVPASSLALANALLLFVSIAVTYLVASFVIFRFLLPHLSLNLHPHFPDIAEVFAQTSKSGTVPRDYIALLGNSYAEGQGDGLLAANGDRANSSTRRTCCIASPGAMW